MLQNLQPSYHTIADFRKLHAEPLQLMFRLYVQFLGDAGLLGKTTIAVDGSKFKAVNSKKNNYNQKKIDKHLQFIKDKTDKYLQELDDLEKQENTITADDLQIKKEKITQGLAKIKERTIKYDDLQQQLNNTDDKQISTTDPDSRSKCCVQLICLNYFSAPKNWQILFFIIIEITIVKCHTAVCSNINFINFVVLKKIVA